MTIATGTHGPLRGIGEPRQRHLTAAALEGLALLAELGFLGEQTEFTGGGFGLGMFENAVTFVEFVDVLGSRSLPVCA